MNELQLTPRARAVLQLAADEARRLKHPYIGTEHILLGIIREGEGIAAGVLESLGVRLDKARTAVEFIIGEGDQPVPLATPAEFSEPPNGGVSALLGVRREVIEEITRRQQQHPRLEAAVHDSEQRIAELDTTIADLDRALAILDPEHYDVPKIGKLPFIGGEGDVDEDAGVPPDD